MAIQTAKTIAEVMSFLFPGFKFNPTDMQLLLDYLKHKILGQLPDGHYLNMLPEVDVLESEPWELYSQLSHKFSGEKLFFFCRLEPKYLSSSRYKRKTKAGYWKPTGKGRPIKTDTGVRIGEKRILVFHKGRMPQGEGTSWVMHEYHLNPKCLGDDHDENEELRDVVCWIKNNKDKKLMTGPAPTSVNEQGNNLNFGANQHNEAAAAAAHPELGESTDPSQHQDGILSDHNTIPTNQSQAGAEEFWSQLLDFQFLDLPNDKDGNELSSRPIFSPSSDPQSYPNFPRFPSPGSYPN